jgi:hypothetical protein
LLMADYLTLFPFAGAVVLDSPGFNGLPG